MDKQIPTLSARSCPCCGTASSRRRTPGFDSLPFGANFIGRDRPQTSLVPWETCATCQLEYAGAVPAEEWFIHLYERSGETDSILDSMATQTALKLWQRKIPANVDSVLDVGCGRGLFLHELKHRGLRVCGSEPNQKLRALSPLSPSEIHPPSDLPKLGTRFSALSFQLSLEHLFDPRKVLLDLHPLLEPNAFLFVLYHSAESASHRLLGPRSPLYDLQHLQIFRPVTIKRLLNSAGFHVISDTAYSNTYPIQYWGRLLGFDLPPFTWIRRPLTLRAGNRVLIAQFQRTT